MFGWMGTAKFAGLQWPRKTRQKPPAWVAKNPIHSYLTPQTISLVFASHLTWAFDDCGPLLMPLSNWSAQGALVPKWLWLPLPLGSSSSEYGDTPYYFSPPQWHSCCHCTTLYKHSVPSGPGVEIHLPCIEPESSHWFPLTVGSPCPCMYNMGWEGISGLGIFSGNYFIIFTGVWLICNSLGSPGLFGLHCSPGLYPLEPIWWHSLKVGSVHSTSQQRWLICLLGLTGALCQKMILDKTLHNSIYLCDIIEEGHTALSINPYLGYVFDPIPLVEGIGIQEGSLCVMSYTLVVPSGGTFGLVTLTWGIQTPFSGAFPSFQFKRVPDLDALTNGHSWTKGSRLLQW